MKMVENVIYETDFDNMKVQVIESTHNRYLKFGNGLKQSSMNKKNPRKLQLKYSKEIVKVFEHIQNPKNVLVLGLGGGILPSFIYENYSDVIIDVVDNIQELKDIAYKYFELPVSDRLNVIIQDAKDYVLSTNKKYDIIIEDLYKDDGKVVFFEFDNDLKNILNDNGVIAFNYMVHQRNYTKYMERLNSSYVDVIEQFKPKLGRYGYNHIAFCKK
jgi:spermidine synthase